MQPQEKSYRENIIKEIESLIDDCPEVNAQGVLLFMREKVDSD